MDKILRARELFLSGCNCSQSVFVPFAESIGVETKNALRISCGLGGGVGRLREVCGAVSGAALVLGLYYAEGEVGPKDKGAVYTKVQEFTKAFSALHPSIVCRELLQTQDHMPKPTPRTDDFYKSRPCLCLVEDAVTILEQMVKQEA